MPIKPENKHRYPANWKEIRAAILERAGHKCETCGVPNYALGARDKQGDWHMIDDIHGMNSGVGIELFGAFPKPVRIILTIAHLDHVPENCDPSNLRALCQKCHLAYDAEHRRAEAARTRAVAKERGDIFASASTSDEPSPASTFYASDFVI